MSSAAAASAEAPSQAALRTPHKTQRLVATEPGIEPEPEPEPEPPVPPRRWVCLVEAPPHRHLRRRFFDGCGLESQAIVGRRVEVEGVGTGQCTDMRQVKWGSAFVHRIIFDNGVTKECRLRHGERCGSGDVSFSVEDDQPLEQPWRWSDDPKFPKPRPGELGNLTPAQQAAVASFRDPGVEGVAEATESTVLRYLRANDFAVPAALEQWQAQLSWRAAQSVDELTRTHQAPEVCASQIQLQSLYPHLMAGYDRGGRPVRIECMGRIRATELYKHTTEEKIMRYHAWQSEEVLRRFLPAASRRTGHEHTQVTAVLDMSGAKLSELFSAASREHVKSYIGLATEYYPEVLHKMVIVNAPRILSVLWDFVKPLLDAQTQRKIAIAPPGVRSRNLLHSLIHPSQLPKFLGGELDTPLDQLLPMVDAGTPCETVGGWDGYWGLETKEAAPQALPPTQPGMTSAAQPDELRASLSSAAGEPPQPEADDATQVMMGVVSKFRETDTDAEDKAARVIAAAFRRRKTRRAAVAQLEKMKGRHELAFLFDQADSLVEQANWRRAEKRVRDAMGAGDFEAWLAEDEDYAEAHEILGACACAHGNYEAAVEAFADGLRYRPDGARLRLGRARALVRLGRSREAASDLKIASALRPEHVPTKQLCLQAAAAAEAEAGPEAVRAHFGTANESIA